MFYLGAPHARFLARTNAPLFVSRRTLENRKTFPRALGAWALDSGAFTEITKFGEWRLSASRYALLALRFSVEIGKLTWAAIQDWMCEPHMLEKTGLTVEEHQIRTVRSLLELRALESRIHWIPVLQGYHPADYVRHVELYAAAGVDFAQESTVGIGSVCRRQNTEEITNLFALLAGMGIRLHGFGVKSAGLVNGQQHLTSADSMAWSKRAWKIGRPAMPECENGPHKNCANCLRFALSWRGALIARLERRWDGGVRSAAFFD